jgi:hypothetical protein
MEQTKLLILIVFLVAAVFMIVKYWKTGKKK